MKKQEMQENEFDLKILPLAPVRKLFLLFCISCMIAVLLGGALLTYRTMIRSAGAAYQSAATQISQKIDESIKLLTGLASLPEFYDPAIPWESKTEKLDEINESYDYMFICYVDQDIQVYTLGEEPASLASREHMQKLYSTKDIIVTDSFVAGADGHTLNYTVAVPLLMDGQMTGSLFCSIYFDNTSELLKDAASANGVQAVMIGSKGQIMSSTNGASYGSAYMDNLKETQLIGVTTDKLQAHLLARETGSFHRLETGNLIYTQYGPIEKTNWDILISVDFWSVYKQMMAYLVSILIIMNAILYGMYRLVKKHIQMQADITKSLVSSMHKLEKKLNMDNSIRDMSYEDILQISSKGLRDGLTGVATRTFFLSQAENLLSKNDQQKLVVLCFIDLDDLKLLNDTYGHLAGDIALKKIGLLLRSYEKKYDGYVGRYGGDEFVIILRDIDDLDELHMILREMIQKLNFSLSLKEAEVDIHCSIGACIWNGKDPLNMIIANADKALYDVKQHGKNEYSIYVNRED